jgi:S-adenosylmethionine hydrolase
MPPVVTLLTDFGTADGYVAEMKGVILTRAPEATVVDVTHDIGPQDVERGRLALARYWRRFPPGTIHVAVVDPGVGTARDIIVVAAAGHAFIAPDNGLLAPVVARTNAPSIYRLDTAKAIAKFKLPVPSATFHGRDLFAPLGAELAAGRAAPADLGPKTTDVVPSWVDEPTVTSDQVSGVIITIDHFGNLITNIDAELIRAFAAPVVRTGGHTLALRRTYGDVRPGEFLALVNSFGVIEIARAEQSAAEALGLGRGAPVTISSR